jgi:hypothetical protein
MYSDERPSVSELKFKFLKNLHPNMHYRNHQKGPVGTAAGGYPDAHKFD